MKRSYLSLISCITSLLLIFTACQSSSEKTSNISEENGVKFFPISKIGVSQLSEVIDRIEYVKLESHADHIAYRIDKVLIENDLVYIFDYFSGRSLSVYDLKGNFQFALTKPGEGPDEYLEIQDFLVDDNSIEVLDALGRLIIYDKQGNFIRSEKLPPIAKAMTKIGDKYLFQTGKIPNTLAEHGRSCEVIQYDFETKNSACVLEINDGKTPHSFKERSVLEEIGKDYYYATYFNDTIYRKATNGFEPSFTLDFSANPGQTIDPDLSITDLVETLNKNKDKIYHNPNLQGNDDYLVTRFSANGNHHVIYDYQKENVSIINSLSANDVDGGLPLYWIHTTYNDELIMVIDSQYLISRFDKLKSEKNEFTPKEEAFLAFASTLTIDDPLVMIKYHLK